MLITIRQTQANGKNLFQVEREGSVLYRARTPWLDIQAPFQAENMREMTFTDVGGNEIFHTVYNLLENAAHTATRYKYLFGATSKLGEYQVVDGDGTVLGSFCTQIDAPFTTRMTIDCGERAYDCYARAMGKIYVISVFDGARQIAQITKPLDVWDRLDVFYLHLDDGYEDLLPILSFFTIYVDAQKFNRPGQITVGAVEKNWSYSFDRNNERYDPDWIARTFGQGEADRLNELLAAHPEKPPEDPARAKRNRRLIIGIAAAVGLVLVVCAAALALAWQLLLRPREPLSPEEFAARVSDYGYTVSEGVPSGVDGSWELCYEASGEDHSLEYLVFPSETAAAQFFAETKALLAERQQGSYVRTSTDLINSQKYTLTSGGSYSVISRIDATVILCAAPEQEKDAIKALLKELGY